MNKEELKENFKGNFAIKEVLDYIDLIDCIFQYKYNNIKCNVYYSKIKTKIDKNKIKKVIKRAYIISNNSKNFIIHLILTPVKKLIEFDKILTAKNTNSGFTFINRNEIFIFREEEYSKVIIHELLHHDKLIHNDDFKLENKEKLINHFGITKDTILILNESIIEFWATLIQIAFVSIEYKLDYLELFKLELKYSLLKTYQILKLKETYKNKLWCDKCNIYSYIIFKTILLLNINDFLKIYTYPYNDTILTNFLINHSEFLNELLKKELYNPSIIINNNQIQRPLDSLCFMLLSDL